MLKMIVVLIIMILALWQLKGMMGEKATTPSGENRVLVPTEVQTDGVQRVEDVMKNYKETFHDQMLIEQKKKRDEQMQKALDRSTQ